MDAESFSKLSRKEIQALAKIEGIPANKTTKYIIAALLAKQVEKENGGPSARPTPATTVANHNSNGDKPVRKSSARALAHSPVNAGKGEGASSISAAKTVAFSGVKSPVRDTTPLPSASNGRIRIPGTPHPSAANRRNRLPGTPHPSASTGRMRLPGTPYPSASNGRIRIPGTPHPSAAIGRSRIPPSTPVTQGTSSRGGRSSFEAATPPDARSVHSASSDSDRGDESREREDGTRCDGDSGSKSHESDTGIKPYLELSFANGTRRVWPSMSAADLAAARMDDPSEDEDEDAEENSDISSRPSSRASRESVAAVDITAFNKEPTSAQRRMEIARSPTVDDMMNCSLRSCATGSARVAGPPTSPTLFPLRPVRDFPTRRRTYLAQESSSSSDPPMEAASRASRSSPANVPGKATPSPRAPQARVPRQHAQASNGLKTVLPTVQEVKQLLNRIAPLTDGGEKTRVSLREMQKLLLITEQRMTDVIEVTRQVTQMRVTLETHYFNKVKDDPRLRNGTWTRQGAPAAAGSQGARGAPVTPNAPRAAPTAPPAPIAPAAPTAPVAHPYHVDVSNSDESVIEVENMTSREIALSDSQEDNSSQEADSPVRLSWAQKGKRRADDVGFASGSPGKRARRAAH